MVGVIEDVTERKRTEARIAHMAHHDPLTDLPNRAAFAEYLARPHTDGEGERTFAVLCIDLDRFKEVNDVFGHSGRRRAAWATSRADCRKLAGEAFVARLGGDEFTDHRGQGAATREPQRNFGGSPAQATVGGKPRYRRPAVARWLEHRDCDLPADGKDAATLLANADAALYRAEGDGRGAIRIFEAEMDSACASAARCRTSCNRRSRKTNSRSITSRRHTSRRDRRLRGAGALASIRAAARYRPSHSFPSRRKAGSIIPIGEWMLREACREAASWPKPLQIAVNLSPIQFRHGDCGAGAHHPAGNRIVAERDSSLKSPKAC